MSAEIDLVNRYNAAIQNSWGDFEGMRALLPEFITPDTTLDEAESLPWGGHWVGVDGFMQVFTTVNTVLKTHTDPELRRVPEDARQVQLDAAMYCDGSKVFSVITRPVHSVEVFDVRDGKIQAVSVYMFDTVAMLAAMTTS